jgi:hypothetical protein
MGNIITTAQGDLVTQNGLSEIKDTAFAKIINDTLLELDLYTGQFAVPEEKDDSGKIVKPTVPAKPEVFYTSSSVLNARPKMGPNDPRLKDINGLPYTTDEDISYVLSEPRPGDDNSEYVMGMDASTRSTNKNYNMKRGFCNGTTTVPVNIVGVDLPTDQYYDNVGKQYYNTVKGNTPIDPSNPNSQTYYNAKQASRGILTMRELDNCIQYGDIAGIEAQPGTYVINNIPSYFYNTGLYIDKTGTLQNQNALLSVDRTKPVYVQPINGVPVGIVSGADQCLITIKYFDPTMILPAINDSMCIGYYAEANPGFIEKSISDQSITDQKQKSQVVLFPLKITEKGQQTRSRRTGPLINTIDALIFYLNEQRLISTSITDIVTVNIRDSPLAISTVPTRIIVPDSNNNPIINNEYPLNTRSAGTFPDTLNYTIFFKSKIVFSQSPVISDIDFSANTKEKLNDYSTKSIYGKTLSTECQVKLNALLTNSYVNTNIPKYTKLNKIYSINDPDNSGTNTPYSDSNSKYYNYIEDPNDPSQFAIKASAPKDMRSYKIFGAPQSPDLGKLVMTSVTPDCNPFYQDLCDYYYKYDVVDGILFNNTFNTQINTNQNISSYLQNLRFITDHIPDCRCLNSRPVQDGLFKSDDYYGKLSCEYDSKLYGTSDPTDAYNSSITEGSLYGGGNNMANPIKLYNINTENLNSYKDINRNQIDISDQEYGFRRQVDPAFSAAKNQPIEMSDSRFLYAENNRSKSVVYNSYTCNQSYSPNISGVGGNVIQSGMKMTCNFPGAPTNAPSTDNTLKSLTASFYNTDGEDKRFITLDGTYKKPIPTNTSIDLVVDFPDITYPDVFLTNYRFILINKIDNTKQILKNSCISSDNINSCIGPYSINVPFIYAPILNDSGVEYIIAMENITPTPKNGKPLNNLTSIGSHLVIKHYSMKITGIKILTSNGIKYVRFNINLNTSDVINNIPYRIIFTPVDSTNTNKIIMYGQDFFNDVNSVNGLLTAQYDSTQPFLDIEYYYKIMVNEKKSFVNRQVIYSDGNQLLYDDKLMNPSDKDVIDFSKVKSGFNQFTLSYYDYDNNQVLNLIGNNDTIKTGVTVVASWNFFSTDIAYTNMNLYYKLNDKDAVEYKITPTPIPVSTGTYAFIFPVFPTSKIVNIYACIVDSITGNNILDVSGKPLLQSVIFTVSSEGLGETFRNWKVILDKTFDSNSKIPITLNSSTSGSSDISIINYLKYAATEKYSNILFDYTLNQWFYSTLNLVSLQNTMNDTDVVSIGSNGLVPTGSSSTSTSFVILQALPIPEQFTIDDIKYLDSTGTSISLYQIPLPTEVQMGSSLNIEWHFTPASNIDIKIQVKIFDQINSSFTIPSGKTNGTHPIMLYDNTGNLNKQQTNVQLVSYETLIKSNVKIISNISSTNIKTTVEIQNGSANAKITTPYVFIENKGIPTSLISNINLTINEPLDNKYHIYYQNIQKNTSISSYNLEFKDIDVTKDINFIHSSQQLQQLQQFSNVNIKYGLRKNYKEHFESPIFSNKKNNEYFDSSNPIIGDSNNTNMQLHIDKLSLDFSSIGVNVNKYLSIVSTFNGYYSINISTLIINMGSTVLDNYKFNLDFNGTFTTVPTQFRITNINIIGKLTTQIMFVKNIAGLENVKYIDQSGNFIKLIYLNGYYAIPEKFLAAPVPVVEQKQDNSWIYWIIGIVFILLIVGLVFYFMRKKK